MKRYFRLTQSKPVLNGWLITGVSFRPGAATRCYFAFGIDREHCLRQMDQYLAADGIEADQILEVGCE